MMGELALILAILASVISLFVGYIVWYGNHKDEQRRSFVLLAAFTSLWIFSNVLFVLSSESFRYVVALSSYAIALVMSVQLLIFTLQLVYPADRRPPLWVVALPGYCVAILSAFPGIVAYGVAGLNILTHKTLLTGYAFCLLFYLATPCIVLVSARFKSVSQGKQGLNVIIGGLFISIIIGFFFNIYLPLAGNYTFTSLGPAGSAVFVGSIAYAILRHGLFDVRLAVVRSVSYFLVLTTMAALYSNATWILTETLKQTVESDSEFFASFTAILLLVLTFQAVKRFFDRLTNRLFYKDNYSSDEFFAKLNRELSQSSDVKTLIKNASRHIANVLKAESVLFYVGYGENREVVLGTNAADGLSQDDINKINQYIAGRHDRAIVSSLLDDSKLLEILKKRKIALIVPLITEEKMCSYLILSEKLSGHYTARDIGILETASDSLAIAIKNALYVHDIKEINDTLQQRIEGATKELRSSNKQLKKLDAAKDEFVSMASHQLRTPLTSVKGYISMVLEGDAGELNPTQRKLLEEAFTSSERMVHLIGDFLNVSRLQTGKFVVDRSSVDLARLVAQEVDSLASTAAAHSLKLSYRKPSYFPALYLDEGKIRQVIMNFVDNAIYYSPQHSVIVLKLAVEEGDAVFTVRDKGMGVPKVQQTHLFTKFFRADNARRQRPDGTGVGLYLAKKVITAHGGSMVFHSVEGEGSTFGFRLPVKKLSEPPVLESADKIVRK